MDMNRSVCERYCNADLRLHVSSLLLSYKQCVQQTICLFIELDSIVDAGIGDHIYLKIVLGNVDSKRRYIWKETNPDLSFI